MLDRGLPLRISACFALTVGVSACGEESSGEEAGASSSESGESGGSGSADGSSSAEGGGSADESGSADGGDGDGDSASSGDGDGASSGDGDGASSGDGDGVSSGDGDGDGASAGDGDGDGTSSGDGDGDGASSGDGDGDGASSGDGDGDGASSGDGDGASSGDGDGDGASAGDGDGDGDQCKTHLTAILRDFSRYHPDFEAYYHYDPPGDPSYAPVTDMVEDMLGPDGLPVWKAGWTETWWGSYFTGETWFDMWFRDHPVPMGTDPMSIPIGEREQYNVRYDLEFPLTNVGNGVLEYSSQGTAGFFPLEATEGFGNEDMMKEGEPTNFHFTTHIHEEFTYIGGEVFNFQGDDDVWVFINEQLVIDKGGLGGTSYELPLDDLGLTPGATYPLDFFHAERRWNGSNIRVSLADFCISPQ